VTIVLGLILMLTVVLFREGLIPTLTGLAGRLRRGGARPR